MNTTTIVIAVLGALLLLLGGYFWYEKDQKSKAVATVVSAGAGALSQTSSQSQKAESACCATGPAPWRIADQDISLRDEPTDMPWDKGSCDYVEFDMQTQANYYGATCNTTCY